MSVLSHFPILPDARLGESQTTRLAVRGERPLHPMCVRYPNLPFRYSSVRLSLGTVNILSVVPNSTSSPRKRKAV